MMYGELVVNILSHCRSSIKKTFYTVVLYCISECADSLHVNNSATTGWGENNAYKADTM